MVKILCKIIEIKSSYLTGSPSPHPVFKCVIDFHRCKSLLDLHTTKHKCYRDSNLIFHF